MMHSRATMGRQGTARTAVVAAALAAIVLVGTARPAHAEAYANDFGIGVGAVFVDLVYMPVKVVYATLGGLTGGFAFVLTGGRMDIATAIWRPALGGTYVITPSMLRGEDPINFSGGGSEEPEEERSAPPRRSTEEPIGDRDHGRRGESY